MRSTGAQPEFFKSKGGLGEFEQFDKHFVKNPKINRQNILEFFLLDKISSKSSISKTNVTCLNTNLLSLYYDPRHF